MELHVPGYDALARTDGTIIGVKGNPLRPYVGDKYPQVVVRRTDTGRLVSRRIHRLIALTFLPVAGEPTDVRHLNDDPSDNRAENLAWGSRADNMRDAESNGRWSPARHRLTRAEAAQLRAEWRPYSRDASAPALARRYGIHERTVWRYIHGTHSRAVAQ